MNGPSRAGTRRVVAFVDIDGRSRLHSSDSAPRDVKYASPPGLRTSLLWATDPEFTIGHGVRDPIPVLGQVVPLPGGTMFETLTLPPDSVYSAADFDPVLAAAEMGRHAPGLAELMEVDAPGFHRTDTIDYIVLLHGEVWIVVDGGETRLVAGDTLVQLGSRHAWRNRSSEPAVLAVVMVGGRRLNAL